MPKRPDGSVPRETPPRVKKPPRQPKRYGPKPEGHIRRSKQTAMELQELREQMGMKRIPADDWCAAAPQELRDQMAARALMAEWLNEYNALVRLGIIAKPKSREPQGEENDAPPYEEIFERIFRTEGVRAILQRDLTDVEKQKKELLARQAQIALHGDDDSATRAFTSVARVAGWNKPDVAPASVSVSLYQMLWTRGEGGDGPRAIAATVNGVALPVAEDFLSHEPGEAAAVPDDD